MLVFDVTEVMSFNNIKEWLNSIDMVCMYANVICSYMMLNVSIIAS